MKAPTHVICPDVPDLPKYLTAGKRYDVIGTWTHRAVEWVPETERFGVKIVDDEDEAIEVFLVRSENLNGADWIPVYADEESMVEAQSEEPKPSGVDRLLIVMGLGRGSDPVDLDALCDDAAAEINLTEIDERRARAIEKEGNRQWDETIGEEPTSMRQARAIRQSDEAAGLKLIDTREYVPVPVELLHEARLAMTGTLPATCTYHDRIRLIKTTLSAILAAQEDDTGPSPKETTEK